MHEKAKQEQQQLSKHDRERPASPMSAASLLPSYDDAFARRAGEIIARAAAPAYRRDNRR
jgi:hypothetical protein